MTKNALSLAGLVWCCALLCAPMGPFEGMILAADSTADSTGSTGTGTTGSTPSPTSMDNQAWDRLRWGMKPQEVSATIGHMVLKVDKPGRFTHQIDGTYKGYKLAFSFFGNRGLERIALIDSSTPGMNERINQIEELLVLKYGAPFRENTRNNVRTMEWLSPTKLVQLYYRDSPRNAMLNLLYTWRKSAMTEEY